MNKIIDKKIIKSALSQIDDKEKINLIILSVILVCIVLGYFVLIPNLSEYKENRIGVESGKNKKEDILQKQDLLKNLGSEMKSSSDFIMKLEDYLPKDSQVPEALITINNIATSNSLYIMNFSPNELKDDSSSGSTKKKNAWKTVELKFDVIGTYPNIKKFISDIENNIRPIDIKTISINGGGNLKESQVSTETILKFNIGANIYYQQ